MPCKYDFSRVQRGMDEAAIERHLKGKLDALQSGAALQITLARTPGYSQGKVRVQIRTDHAEFLDREEHSRVPVAMKSAIKVLWRAGVTGRFDIRLSGDLLLLEPAGRHSVGIGSHGATKPPSMPDHDPDLLWEQVLADPVPLFRIAASDPMLAVFDDKGFFLSDEAGRAYYRIKSLPHVYAPRFESENAYYFGLSNQSGGRWKRSHAYHLGGLAHEILGTKRYDDQDHSAWVAAWFEPFTGERHDSYYVIRMKERVVISFWVPQPRGSKAELAFAESSLIALARNRGLTVLNKRP